MATTQQYSLRWNNYFRHLTYALDNHRTNDDFVDVSLCCDGRKIKAHKVVLSSCSTYFKEIFKENPHPHPVIIFKFIKFDDLNSIIEFMYQGEVNVQQEALQSFLQTAELLAVQGLTAEEKEKPKPAPINAIDEQQKLIKTIPSTIRPLNDVPTVTATQVATQTIDTGIGNGGHLSLTISGQSMSTPIATQTSTQTIETSSHLNLNLQPQLQHHQQQVTQHTQQQQQHHQQHQQQQTQISHLVTIPSGTVTTTGNTSKKRKIFTASDDDSIYATETVDYGVKDDTTIVKNAEMSFLRGTVKMDIPEYIVGDVDDSQQLSDGAGTQQVTHEVTDVGTVAVTSSAQNVTQYTSEYEILTESEIEEKFQQVDADNAEITIEMGRLLNSAGGGSTTITTNTQGNVLDETGSSVASIGSGTAGPGGGGVLKMDNKSSGTTDLPSNKWTECQFCKMVITTVNLWRHIRTQHTPQPPRKCELCNKNFKNKYSLREHIRISHEQKIAVRSEN